MPKEFLDNLRRYGYTDEQSLMELLDHWMRYHSDQPTWKELADAVEDICDYELASTIKGIYDSAGKSEFFVY